MSPLAPLAAGLAAALACVPVAHAGVVIANTRVVFPGDARDVTVRLANPGSHPVLVEAWIEGATDGATVPLSPDPPLFRIDPGKGQTVRVHRLPGALAEDRETLFFLNVLEVPPKPETADASTMTIALRTRIKLFHRPAGLAGTAARAPDAVQWRVIDGTRMEAANPTPFHVTIARVVDVEGLHGEMVAPFETRAFAIAPIATPRASIVFEAINDFGGRDRFERPLRVEGATR